MFAHTHTSLIPIFKLSLSAMVRGRGRGGTPAVATRASAPQRIPPPLDHAVVEPAMRGGGRGEIVVVVALEEEEDGAALWPRPHQRLLPRWKATLETSLESSSSGYTSLRVATSASLHHSHG